MANSISRSPPPIRPDARDMLYHYARGEFPYWGDDDPAMFWHAPAHRGIQMLNEIAIPKGQKRYVVTDRFTFRWNGDFAGVLAACADPSRPGRFWLTPTLIEGYQNLHRLGYAFSAEAWQDQQLVGGLFGVHIGSFVSVESMFHRANHASKFAYGQLLLRLHEQGFQMLDVNFVQPHFEQFGAKWVPGWRFSQLMNPLLRQPRSLDGVLPPAVLPRNIAMRLALRRIVRGAARRVIKLVPRRNKPVAASPVANQ